MCSRRNIIANFASGEFTGAAQKGSFYYTTTGNKFKMKSSCIEEAKVDAENFLKEYWKRVQKDINKITDKIS